MHFIHCEDASFSIANAIGKPFQVDHSSPTFNRPSIVRVWIKYNVLWPLLPRLWIGEGDDGFWQDIIF